MVKNIGYHTRLDSNNTVKVVGCSFGGTVDIETVNRLVNAHFNVTVKPSGRAVFVDKEGREVSLYLTVDPKLTAKGDEALKQWRIETERIRKEEAKRQAEQDEHIEELLSKLTYDEIVTRLTKED